MGPFILRDTVKYLPVLRQEIWPVISIRENIEDLIFMQDGSPPHFAIVVREWLNGHFPGRWMGRCGPHEWPDRSPDLTPFGGLVEGASLLYKPTTLEELEGRIREVMFSIPQWFLVKSVDAVPSRLEKLVANVRTHIECQVKTPCNTLGGEIS